MSVTGPGLQSKCLRHQSLCPPHRATLPVTFCHSWTRWPRSVFLSRVFRDSEPWWAFEYFSVLFSKRQKGLQGQDCCSRLQTGCFQGGTCATSISGEAVPRPSDCDLSPSLVSASVIVREAARCRHCLHPLLPCVALAPALPSRSRGSLSSSKEHIHHLPNRCRTQPSHLPDSWSRVHACAGREGWDRWTEWP